MFKKKKTDTAQSSSITEEIISKYSVKSFSLVSDEECRLHLKLKILLFGILVAKFDMKAKNSTSQLSEEQEVESVLWNWALDILFLPNNEESL